FKAGLITPSGGNVSVRLPGGALITPSGMHKGSLRPPDLVEVDAAGRPRAPGRRPSVETGLHLLVYQRRPEVNAVIHTHAPMATLLGLLDLPVPPVTLEAVRFADLPSVPFFRPGSDDLAEAVADDLGAAPAALLRNHGLVTVGADLRAAADAALALEEVAHLVVTCGLLGREPSTIPPEAVKALKQLFLG
ncbi:MAG: class II aldolase/adducin family protein, partial [Bacillota bacterium]